MSKVYLTKGECATECATMVFTSAIESLRRSGRVVKCGGLAKCWLVLPFDIFE
jgi:hypothetical protein